MRLGRRPPGRGGRVGACSPWRSRRSRRSARHGRRRRSSRPPASAPRGSRSPWRSPARLSAWYAARFQLLAFGPDRGRVAGARPAPGPDRGRRRRGRRDRLDRPRCAVVARRPRRSWPESPGVRLPVRCGLGDGAVRRGWCSRSSPSRSVRFACGSPARTARSTGRRAAVADWFAIPDAHRARGGRARRSGSRPASPPSTPRCSTRRRVRSRSAAAAGRGCPRAARRSCGRRRRPRRRRRRPLRRPRLGRPRRPSPRSTASVRRTRANPSAGPAATTRRHATGRVHQSYVVIAAGVVVLAVRRGAGAVAGMLTARRSLVPFVGALAVAACARRHRTVAADRGDRHRPRARSSCSSPPGSGSTPAPTSCSNSAERLEWIPTLGVAWSVGVDGISLAVATMAAVVFGAAIAYPTDTRGSRPASTTGGCCSSRPCRSGCSSPPTCSCSTCSST